MSDLCTDNRFELIEKYKKKLIEATNIETSMEEMKVLDSILFRFWQMGWLDKLDLPSVEQRGKTMAERKMVYLDDAIDVTWEEPSYTDALNVLTEVRDKIRALPTVVEPQMDLINTEGLDEQIRCEMCRNPMHTDRGCDGNCKYDDKLYERIMQILVERIKPSPSAQPFHNTTISDVPDTNVGDSISRQAAIDKFTSIPVIDGLGLQPLITVDDAVNALEKLPSTQSEIEESLYRYKCFITDAEGLQHEVVHVGDIRRVTGWEI